MKILTVVAVVLLMACCSWANPIINPSFEIPGLSAGGLQYRPTLATWVFTGSSGIGANGSAIGVTSAPDGTQAAFIQTNTGDISQAISGLMIGNTYYVTFAAAQRPGGLTYGGMEDFSVLWNGTSLGTFLPSSTSFSFFATAGFTATATSGTLEFKGMDTVGGDQTAFIDATSMTQAPEPTTAITAIFGVGLLGFGRLVRKRANSSQ